MTLSGLFELWESTGVFFLEHVNKILILRRFKEGVSFSERVGRVRHTCICCLLKFFAAKRLRESWDQGLRVVYKTDTFSGDPHVILHVAKKHGSKSKSSWSLPIDWLGSGVPGIKWSQGKGQVQPGRRAASFGSDFCQLGSNIMAMAP